MVLRRSGVSLGFFCFSACFGRGHRPRWLLRLQVVQLLRQCKFLQEPDYRMVEHAFRDIQAVRRAEGLKDNPTHDGPASIIVGVMPFW